MKVIIRENPQWSGVSDGLNVASRIIAAEQKPAIEVKPQHIVVCPLLLKASRVGVPQKLDHVTKIYFLGF